MDVLVVAGEASGDQHAAEVVHALRARRPDLHFFGMGGAKLAQAGVELIHGAHEISVMGLVEVLPKVPRILTVLGDLTDAARRRRPAVAVLVDVPDFNLRLAKRLKTLGVPTVGYVAPMAWAWREGRTRVIAKRYDRLCCILPFEEPFFRDRGVQATYVGNPVVTQLPAPATPEHFRAHLGLPLDRPVLAVLPGSRRSELSRLGSLLAHAAAALLRAHPELQVVVPVAPGLSEAAVRAPFEAAAVAVRCVSGQAPEVVGASQLALVASGTATLEAALMGRPLVAVYRVNALTYGIGRMLVRVPFFSLPNVLLGRRVIPELLQADASVERVTSEAEALWAGPAREACVAGLHQLRAVLGTKRAADEVATQVLSLTP